MDSVFGHLSPELLGFLLTLALGMLIGFEREEHEPDGLGGVRTFPLIALAGFLLVAVFPSSPLPFALGLVVLGVLLALSHWDNIRSGQPGLTTEIAAALTFIIGACTANRLYWIAVATGVVAVILLQEKRRLEGLASRVPRRELRMLVRFLLITGVILPAVTNRSFTAFELNPFTIWLVVVAVSGVSYLSYLLQLRWGAEKGVMLAGLLGGAYSSTVTTVALARRSAESDRPGLAFAAAITAATGVMYIRLWILVVLFAPNLAGRLTVLFWTLGTAAILTGLVLARLSAEKATAGPAESQERPSRNPLEMTSAFTFAGLFLGVLIITRLVAERFGGGGVLVMAAIMGTTDVDPFILGLTQYAGHGLDLGVAALAVVVAAAANNVMKGIYASIFGSRSAGRAALGLLLLFAVASVALYPVLS